MPVVTAGCLHSTYQNRSGAEEAPSRCMFTLFHLLLCLVGIIPLCTCCSDRTQNQIRKMSFVPVQNDSDFPLENLPYGVFSTATNVSFYENQLNC